MRCHLANVPASALARHARPSRKAAVNHYAGVMASLPAPDIYDEDLGQVVDRVAREGMRIVVTCHGRPVAAVIPIEDLEVLEDFEDSHDAAAIEHALGEDEGARITLDELRARLGM